MKLLLAYWTGMLPFMRIQNEVFSAPYMTRDYFKMKLIEAREKSSILYFHMMIVILANWSMNPMLDHLNKRGIFTNYWVINDDDEVHKVMRETKVQGIMTDRPSDVKRILQQEG